MARGEAWSPANHHHWPDAFKAAARTLLLLASGRADVHVSGDGKDDDQSPQAADSNDCGGTGTSLADLPAGALLRIVQLAAAPMSAWL